MKAMRTHGEHIESKMCMRHASLRLPSGNRIHGRQMQRRISHITVAAAVAHLHIRGEDVGVGRMT